MSLDNMLEMTCTRSKSRITKNQKDRKMLGASRQIDYRLLLLPLVDAVAPFVLPHI
jgi:hypothetical protein